jgi:hypothetical protein
VFKVEFWLEFCTPNEQSSGQVWKEGGGFGGRKEVEGEEVHVYSGEGWEGSDRKSNVNTSKQDERRATRREELYLSP